ncbi:hypothetical protein [Kocuria massiliensis]|uniref:hypothetical protein n=1 Tax=Kocuria massiliensis TaxID=1926282 RepID=UPI0022B9BCA8|nr:hypothetical protein [Kocuria massiliensis]
MKIIAKNHHREPILKRGSTYLNLIIVVILVLSGIWVINRTVDKTKVCTVEDVSVSTSAGGTTGGNSHDLHITSDDCQNITIAKAFQSSGQAEELKKKLEKGKKYKFHVKPIQFSFIDGNLAAKSFEGPVS